MATRTTSKLLLLIFPLLFAFLMPCYGYYCRFKDNYAAGGGNKIKGMFVFGSSLVDNGNNNFLPNSLSKGNYAPYGIDFPYGATGRFTNGKNMIDLLGENLDLPLIPVFLDPATNGDKIVNGVNYASGGSGILDGTGSVAVQVIPLNQQIRNFENVTLPDLEAQLGCNSGDSLPNYLFVVGTGGNDYSFNYFLNNNANVSLEVFTDNLISLLTQQLQKLYNLGGRKFVLISVNPLGCYPYIRALQPVGQDGCVERCNQAAELFNARLKLTIDDIKRRLSMPFSTLVFVNSYKIIRDIITDPATNGFYDTRSACCEVGVTGILCKRGGGVCAERNTHVFFDGLHPTEAVNIQIANRAFASNQKDDVYPINVQQLVKL